LQLPSGDIYFFHVNQERFSPDVGIPLAMVRTGRDGLHRTQVRPEFFHTLDVLWEPDGSAALIFELGGRNLIQVTLARPDGSPLLTVLEGVRIRNPMWGP
jgi:hypothetical protein